MSIETPSRRSTVGLLMVLVGLALVSSTVWLLPATRAQQRGAVLHMSLIAVAALALWLSDLPRRHPSSLVVYPLLVFAGLAVLGASTMTLGSTYTGLFTVSFVFVGLYLRRGTATALVIPAALCWLTANGGFTGAPLRPLGVRMPIALAVWVGVAELLAARSRSTRQESQRLRTVADIDPLTGLNNRRNLDALLAAVCPGDALVLLDLDHFKNVNDTHGHAIGDLVLTDFAGVVRGSLRAGDTAIRYGGEEVLLHLPQTTLEQLSSVLNRLRDAWSAIAPLTTFSAGAAIVNDTDAGHAVLALADDSLYQAKREGRDRAVLAGTAAPVPVLRDPAPTAS